MMTAQKSGRLLRNKGQVMKHYLSFVCYSLQFISFIKLWM